MIDDPLTRQFSRPSGLNDHWDGFERSIGNALLPMENNVGKNTMRLDYLATSLSTLLSRYAE